MKLSHLLFILSQVILVSLLAAGRVRCEHMPTVFVLETSDSDSSAISSSNGESSSSSVKSSPQDDMLTKTEIITDEAASNVKQIVASSSNNNNGTTAKLAAYDQNESKQNNQNKNNNPRRQQQNNKTNNSSEGDDDEHHQVSSKTEHKPKSEQHQHDASKRDHDDHHSATDHTTSESVQNDEAPPATRHRDNSAARRSLDSESQLAPARDKPIHPGPHHHGPPPHHHEPPHHPPHHHDHPPPPPPPHHKDHPAPHEDHPPHNNERRDQTAHPTNSPSQRSKPGVTTASTTTASSYQDQDQAPKTEERLLISITSDDDESYPRPPKQAGGSSGSQIGGYNDEPGQHLQQPHHHQKRKPAITISIQDQGRINTQNGGSGHQAVILRPTEDGIVIATLGGNNNNNNNNNNKLKPSGGGSGGGGGGGGGGGVGLLSGLIGAVSAINQQHGGGSSHNNNNNEPYQEPVNNPIRPILTTRNPIINEPYSNGNNNNNNREPISSTLLAGSRPQQPWTDERPQKPTFDESAAISDTTRRPTNRPTFQETPSGSSSNQQQDYENNGSNGGGGGEHLGPKYPLNEKNCGIMHETRIVGGDEADPDDFMWMAAIIKSKPRDGEPRPFCGGSLITRRHILTAAHCLEGLAPRDVLVRLGGYDFEDSASSSSADFAIDQFRVPAQYSKKTHVADIAIMRLKTPLSPNDNYKTVCMPQPRRSYVGALGTVTGYGSQSQTFRRAAPKLRQVTVPIWENRKCSAVYKKNLTESFMCAGYEEGGKDACQGDSGGPLMTEGPEQKMMIVGVVSHGIGCGAPGYPGVYTRTSTFVDWIEKNTKE